MRRVIRLTEIWRDDAPGERRAAFVNNGNIVEIHIQRDALWILGEYGAGRIDRKTPSGAYVIADDNSELLLRGKMGLPEGARIMFEVTREAIAEPGRHKPPEIILREGVHEAPIDKDALWDARMASLGQSVTNASIAEGFDVAIAGQSQIGDVTISFQRTKAGLVFDIDGIGDAFAINMIAATEIARLLRLYQVGAMVLIDFVSMESKAQRTQIAEAFDAASLADPRPFERTAINGYGMMQVMRARPRPSILDHLFGTRIAALSDETQAYWLLRAVAESRGFGVRSVTARPEVATLLQSERLSAWRAGAVRLAGADMVVVADEKVTGYGHVHVAQS
ncbi:ribonuclease E/G [Sphingorhabdus sp.]|uniref:ribonuclease E/G n=1 Tax=Sphingorhabdus sp. TaxID=1902408 RepID=UPI0037CAD2A0